MKNIKKSLLIFTLILIGLISARQVLAATTYTKAQVAEHSTSSSCWATYNNGVYDITTYLKIHNQRYYDITSWCGNDMTADFDAIGKHRGEATTLLASFKIGVLGATTAATTIPNTATNSETTSTPINSTSNDTTTTIGITNPYNLLLPLILGVFLYWGSLLIFKTRLKQFNAFWNSILILTFVIPSFGFGIFMMLQYQFPKLMDIDFKFMYWHVELSVFMSVLAISHFIRRLKIYLMQIKK